MIFKKLFLSKSIMSDKLIWVQNDIKALSARDRKRFLISIEKTISKYRKNLRKTQNSCE